MPTRQSGGRDRLALRLSSPCLPAAPAPLPTAALLQQAQGSCRQPCTPPVTHKTLSQSSRSGSQRPSRYAEAKPACHVPPRESPAFPSPCPRHRQPGRGGSVGGSVQRSGGTHHPPNGKPSRRRQTPPTSGASSGAGPSPRQPPLQNRSPRWGLGPFLQLWVQTTLGFAFQFLGKRRQLLRL